MPIYEYRCNDCGAVSEVYAGMGELNDALSCKTCGSSQLVKLISSATIPTFSSRPSGSTCCGREERCGTPSCATGEACRSGR